MINDPAELEKFWAGEFGNEYTARNQGDNLIASNISLFSKIFANIAPIRSLIEFGANAGLNLTAIRQLFPQISLSAIEINSQAVRELERLENIRIYHTSIPEFQPDFPRDLVLTKGVLIHIHPDKLSQTYDLLYQTSARYICLAEYYNPSPVEVTYRGHGGRLFKRDFAGDLLDKFKDLRLRDYGFVYRRDRNFPQDDLNWFLLEKKLPLSFQGRGWGGVG